MCRVTAIHFSRESLAGSLWRINDLCATDRPPHIEQPDSRVIANDKGRVGEEEGLGGKQGGRSDSCEEAWGKRGGDGEGE